MSNIFQSEATEVGLLPPFTFDTAVLVTDMRKLMIVGKLWLLDIMSVMDMLAHLLCS